MSDKIVRLDEEMIKSELKEVVRNSLEETPNGLLEQEALELTNAARYERTKGRKGYRSGQYSRQFATTPGEVTLQMLKL